MGANDDEPGHITISPTAFALLVGSALAGGAGGGTFFGTQFEKQSLQACYDNSKIALEVVAQHGEEFVDVKKLIGQNRALIYERTEGRYTIEDAAKRWTEHERKQEAEARSIWRRLEAIEREVDRLNDSN